MYQTIKAVSNKTSVLIMVVFGDADWNAPNSSRYMMHIVPGGYFLLSSNDTRNYRGEFHVFAVEEMMRLWEMPDGTRKASTVLGEKRMRYAAELDKDGIITVSEVPELMS